MQQGQQQRRCGGAVKQESRGVLGKPLLNGLLRMLID